ncbi:MAG TPA: FtsQ-type POTRA domain-containing protein [Patescibacteria group bacterium]|nr:FtsQ-type POTRA domain-containing protein [Patescibacteria group bacterium]
MQTSLRVKAARRRRIWLGFLGMVVAAGLVVGFLYVNSSVFFVGEILVEGNKYITAEDVYQVAGIPETVNIFRLNVTNVKTQLLGDLRIAEAEVSRRFPATIVIKVKERLPVAVVGVPYGFAEIDRRGVVLSVSKNLKRMQVPMITGIQAGNVYVADRINDPLLDTVLDYLSALEEPTLNQLSEINVRSVNEMVAYSLDSVVLRLGNGERMQEKAQLTASILQEMKTKKMKVEYIDLSYVPPIIKMR